jgi:hypothetical protein
VVCAVLLLALRGASGAAEDAPALAVRVSSCPEKATVYVDARRKGRTPGELTGLDAATHRITFSKKGYQDRIVLFDPSTATNLQIHLPLVPAEVHARASRASRGLLVATCPDDAAIFVDDDWRGNGAAFLPELNSGAHVIVAVRPGYAIGRRVVTLDDAPPRPVDLVLPPASVPPPTTGATAHLAVDTCPAGAAVVVDGKERGTSPLVVDVAPGRHELLLALPGHRGRYEIVAVADGAHRELRLPLHVARAETQDAGPWVSAATCPDGLEIQVNGFKEGRTPLIFKAPPGLIMLEARPSGGGPAARRQLAVPGDGVTLAEFVLETPGAGHE